MKNLKSTSTSKILKIFSLFIGLGLLLGFQSVMPTQVFGRIFIDINAPSIQRIKIAIPAFQNLSGGKTHPEFASALPGVVSNDLDLSGYFTPMEKQAFLGGNSGPSTSGGVQLRDWSVIGADLLLEGRYSFIGRSLEVEARLYDVFRGRQIFGKRFLGKSLEHRALMHRLSNEIIYALTGQKGMFLSRVAFVGTATGHKEIYLCDVDGQNIKRITSDKSIALLPRWSPKGNLMLYNSFKEGGAMLYMKDMKSGAVKRISGRNGLNIGASWAPDGKSAALTLSHGKNPDIYRIDLKGKVIKQLTNHWGIDVSPSFSPDGKKIAFVSNRSGSPQIYLRELRSGKEERLTFEPTLKYNQSPSWSARNRIAFSGVNNGVIDIFTIDADGSNLRQLTDGQGKNEDPCWSPDGRYLLFSSNRTGRYQLYLMNANGQNPRRISSSKGDQTSPSWSPF
jgi:TolB protein